jgi:hypothetical protein
VSACWSTRRSVSTWGHSASRAKQNSRKASKPLAWMRSMNKSTSVSPPSPPPPPPRERLPVDLRYDAALEQDAEEVGSLELPQEARLVPAEEESHLRRADLRLLALHSRGRGRESGDPRRGSLDQGSNRCAATEADGLGRRSGPYCARATPSIAAWRPIRRASSARTTSPALGGGDDDGGGGGGGGGGGDVANCAASATPARRDQRRSPRRSPSRPPSPRAGGLRPPPRPSPRGCRPRRPTPNGRGRCSRARPSSRPNCRPRARAS